MRSTFVAVGLAKLIYRLGGSEAHVDVRLENKGSAYRLEIKYAGAPAAHDELLALVAESGLPALLPAISKPLTDKEIKRKETGEPMELKYEPYGFSGESINYAKQQELAEASSAHRRERREGDAPVRAPDFPLWAHLCSHFVKGSAMRTGYPLMVHTWHAHQGENAVALLDLILTTYSEFPNPIDWAAGVWTKEIKPRLDYPHFDLFGWGGNKSGTTALSVVSPSTAKGTYGATAAKGSTSVRTPKVFWLEMYLAFAGFMTIAMPYRAGSDVLTYYPQPHNIRITRLISLMEDFRDQEYARDLYDYSNRMPRAASTLSVR